MRSVCWRRKIEHSKRARLGAPTAADYQAQQQLREKCVKWLQNEGSAVTAYQFVSDKSLPTSSWSPTRIESLRLGKNSADPSEPMGTYANEPALRAMAATSWQNLVVINSRAGSNMPNNDKAFKGQPPDKVTVYPPGHRRAALVAQI